MKVGSHGVEGRLLDVAVASEELFDSLEAENGLEDILVGLDRFAHFF